MLLYQVVAREGIAYLEVRVMELISEGWEPLGGVAYQAGLRLYLQAMVRR